ncbi:MAG: response regulator [Phototrophicaceae bacterium]
MKVLYVEDNPANVFLVKRVARMGQHEIINYIDGDQALAKFDEIAPSLVLMDIQLAGNKSGLDVVKALRARGITTPIIAVTAYAMVGDKERCIDAGCDDYLAKPLPIQQLVKIFEHYANLASTEPTTVAPSVSDAVTISEAISEPATSVATNEKETVTTEIATENKITPESADSVATIDQAQVDPVISDADTVIEPQPNTASNNPTEYDETQEISAAAITTSTVEDNDDTVKDAPSIVEDKPADIGEKS